MTRQRSTGILRRLTPSSSLAQDATLSRLRSRVRIPPGSPPNWTDDAGQELVESTLAGKFVVATLRIFPGREREPPHEKLLQDLSSLRGLPMQHRLPLRESRSSFAIKSPDIGGRHPWRLTEAGQLGAELIARGLSRLESLEEGAEVAALRDGGRQPGELVVQLRQPLGEASRRVSRASADGRSASRALRIVASTPAGCRTPVSIVDSTSWSVATIGTSSPLSHTLRPRWW